MNFRMCKSIKGRRGGVIVDAVISLPIFLIAMLTLSYLVLIPSAKENVMHSFADEARRLAIDERGTLGSAISIASYESRFTNRLQTENDNRIKNVSASKLSVPAGIGDLGSVIRLKVKYKVPIKLPIKIIPDISESETLLFRKFVGKSNSGAKMPFSEMEKAVQSDKVWVFPRAGERYHKESCRFISNKPAELIFTYAVRSRYSPCRLCSPGDSPYGSLVYCFTRSGKVYHAASCALVDKYVISYQREEARERGYIPCNVCGG